MTVHQKRLIFLSFIIYIIACFGFIKVLDLEQYNMPWVLAFKNTSFLHMYDKSFTDVWAINYPPIIGIVFYYIHNYVIWAYEHNLMYLAYGLVKLPFVLAHFIILYYFYDTKNNKVFMFWALNPLWFIVTGLWGQFDELFCFIIYLLIDMMYHKKYKHIWSLFAVMCLFKHQGAYFVFPVLLYTCILKLDIYQKIKGFLIGLFIGIMGWCPFIWLYKDILYPIRFMLHMMSENSVISMAINPWFLIQVIRLYETDVLFKFANLFILLCVVLLLITYIKSKDIVISTYIYMLSIYMFSLGQRERYILYSLIIAYYICYIIRDTSYLKIYKAFRVSAIISLSFFLINTISPKDVAYYSLYIILPLYFLLAVWLLIKTANIYNLIFSKPKV